MNEKIDKNKKFAVVSVCLACVLGLLCFLGFTSDAAEVLTPLADSIYVQGILTGNDGDSIEYFPSIGWDLYFYTWKYYDINSSALDAFAYIVEETFYFDCIRFEFLDDGEGARITLYNTKTSEERLLTSNSYAVNVSSEWFLNFPLDNPLVINTAYDAYDNEEGLDAEMAYDIVYDHFSGGQTVQQPEYVTPPAEETETTTEATETPEPTPDTSSNAVSGKFLWKDTLDFDTYFEGAYFTLESTTGSNSFTRYTNSEDLREWQKITAIWVDGRDVYYKFDGDSTYTIVYTNEIWEAAEYQYIYLDEDTPMYISDSALRWWNLNVTAYAASSSLFNADQYIKPVNSLGADIDDWILVTAPVGNTVTYTLPEIDGYVLSSSQSAVITFTSGAASSYSAVYEKAEGDYYTLTIHYRFGYNNSEARASDVIKLYDNSYAVYVPRIDGYTPNVSIVKGSATTDEVVYVYYYNGNASSIGPDQLEKEYKKGYNDGFNMGQNNASANPFTGLLQGAWGSIVDTYDYVTNGIAFGGVTLGNVIFTLVAIVAIGFIVKLLI